MSSIWDNKVVLEELEKMRDTYRLMGKRLTFDCMNLIISGGKVGCRYKDIKGVSLLPVLRGVTYTPCKDCPLFTMEDRKL